MSYYLLDHANPTGPNYYPTRRRPLLAIVVHCTAGLEDTDLIGPDQSAENTARYAATTDRDVSWHSGSDSDSWVDLLPYSFTAWQCVDYNSSTAGHEISKLDMVWADEDPDWVERTLRMAAVGPDGQGGLARKAREHGIPLRRATKTELDHAIAAAGPPVGFITHYELDPTRRTDPGRDFPWARLFALMANPQEDDTMTPEDRADLIRDIVDAVWAEPLQGELGAPERAGQLLVRARIYGATGRDLLPGISARAVSTVSALAELLGRPTADVDEAALAAELAPLLPSTVGTLSDDTLSAIARAVADEQGHRLGRAEPAPVDPAPAESGA